MFVIGSNLTEMSRICCVYFERREKKRERKYRFEIEKKKKGWQRMQRKEVINKL